MPDRAHAGGWIWWTVLCVLLVLLMGRAFYGGSSSLEKFICESCGAVREVKKRTIRGLSFDVDVRTRSTLLSKALMENREACPHAWRLTWEDYHSRRECGHGRKLGVAELILKHYVIDSDKAVQAIQDAAMEKNADPRNVWKIVLNYLYSDEARDYYSSQNLTVRAMKEETRRILIKKLELSATMPPTNSIPPK